MYPAYPVNFSNAVSPGDKFYGSVTFNGGSSYTLVLKDLTKGSISSLSGGNSFTATWLRAN
jgi:hypothetical protein